MKKFLDPLPINTNEKKTAVDFANVCRCGKCKYGNEQPGGKIMCMSVMDGQCNAPSDFCSFGKIRGEDE